MDKLKKSDYKSSSSRGSQEDGSCETPGRKDSPKRPIAMTNSSGVAKTKVGSINDLKAHVVQKRDNRLTQSGDTSSAKK
jgi:hypothetical protein